MIPVFISVDKHICNYVEPLYNSIVANTKEEVKFHILCDMNVPEWKRDVYKSNGWIVNIVNVPEITFNKGRITKAMYHRWLISYITSYEKAIYMDLDVIILGDLAEVFNIDLGNLYVAAVKDFYRDNVYDAWRIHCMYATKPEESFKEIPSFYSGFLLINCNKWREERLYIKLTELANKYKLYDMSALNIVVGKDYYELDKEWCFPGFNYLEDKIAYGNLTDRMRNRVFGTIKAIHWNGPVKPWNYRAKDIENKKIYNLETYVSYAKN